LISSAIKLLSSHMNKEIIKVFDRIRINQDLFTIDLSNLLPVTKD